MILALAGGVGGARLAHGLAQVLTPEELTIVVNTGDDFTHLGLNISPDLDTVMYTLAGINDPQKGWGIANESWNFMENLARLGGETWFQLGDRDLATNVERTRRLHDDQSLSAVTEYLCQRLDVWHRVAPMSDDPVRTRVHTTDGVLDFQDYFVRQRAKPSVVRLEYAGAAESRMSSPLRSCFENTALRAVIVCPSNPYLSIAPILAIPGVRDAIANARVPRLAVSPIVGGRAIKGPAAKIMGELGKSVSAIEIARFYRGLVDGLVIDNVDENLCEAIAQEGITPFVTETVMREPEDRRQLARDVMRFAGQIKPPAVRGASA